MKIIPQLFRIILISIIVLALNACQAPPKEQESGWTSGSGEVRPGPKTGKAVLALLAKAREASKRGELMTAESQLERALRIEPRNPTLWLYMAKLRYFNNKFTEAINLAKKALALSSGTPSEVNPNTLRADCWRVISHSYMKQGDIRQAKIAEDKAISLSH